MYLTLNIILDALSPNTLLVPAAPPGKRRFTQVKLLPDTAEGLSEDCLYIGELDEAKKFHFLEPEICCVCPWGAGPAPRAEVPNLVLVADEPSLLRLYDRIQAAAARVFQWNAAMQECVIRGMGLQSLLDLSAPVLHNYIAVTDSAFKLLACTLDNVPQDDPVAAGLVKNGYHTSEIMEGFRRTQRFQAWEHSQGQLIVNTAQQLTPYDVVSKVFKYWNQYFIHVVMTCNQAPLTDGLSDLFEMFLDVVAIYVEQAWNNQHNSTHSYDSFLTDLLDEAIPDLTVARDRAETARIPFDSYFILLKVVDFDTGLYPVGRMVQHLVDQIPNAVAIPYQGSVVVLKTLYPGEIVKKVDDLIDSLSGFLDKHNAYCGMSGVFRRLDDMALAYRQASEALRSARQLEQAKILPETHFSGLEGGRIAKFEMFFEYCLLSEVSDALPLLWKTQYGVVLRRLWEYDSKNGSNHLEFLYVYLCCNQNASKTGHILHMHRNNALYRIHRIEEITGADFSDPHRGVCFLFLCKLLQINGFPKDADELLFPT